MKIRFPCGHLVEVNFDGRGRFVACTTCGEWAGVDREEETQVFYHATPTTYKPIVNENNLR